MTGRQGVEGAEATSPIGKPEHAGLRVPTSFGEIVDEIVRCTEIPRAEVERRVWMEAMEPGSNVLEDVRGFGVTPHEHDPAMERLYRDGDGFIYETLVFWVRPTRTPWTWDAAERIERYRRRTGRSADDVEILMLGDGAGNDSMVLADLGFRVHYFDVPGSRTYEFALRRFEHHGLLGDRVRLVPDYKSCLERTFDVVVCFEVLEHLPDPVRAIGELGAMLKTDGIALITEDFGDLDDHLPTHLRESCRYVGRTPFLFLAGGMVLTWYNRTLPFKPMEFVKVERVGWRDRWRLWRDARVRGAFFERYMNHLTRRLEKVPYLGG